MPLMPKVLDGEILSARKSPHPHGGNPTWSKGMPSANAGGYSKEARAFNEQFRTLGGKALERVTEILDNVDGDYDPEYVGNVARWVIERGFGKVVPAVHDPQVDTETRTMTVTFVAPKKEGS